MTEHLQIVSLLLEYCERCTERGILIYKLLVQDVLELLLFEIFIVGLHKEWKFDRLVKVPRILRLLVKEKLKVSASRLQ